MSKSEVYSPSHYAFGELKQAVRSHREVKEIGHEINLSGRKSTQLSNIHREALRVADRMLETHATWIDEKIDQILPYFTSRHEDEENDGGQVLVDPRTFIAEAFNNGLIPVLTQEYKVEKQSIDSNRTSSDFGLDNIIAGYTVDFYRTLRVCQRAGVNPNTVLRIAQLTHNHNPNVLIELTIDPRYKDLSPSVIRSAALGYPSNPEAFLDGFIVKIEELTIDPRYKDLSPSVIERAALNYPSNPEAFLDGFIVKIEELTTDPRYKDLNPSVIERAALGYPSNPEAFLDGFIVKIEELSYTTS